METLLAVFERLAHLDTFLLAWADAYGPWAYVILFVIIFSETGLVVAPFLPGDSLLFVAGAVAGLGALDVNVLVVVLIVAAFLGNFTNFRIGVYLSAHVLAGGKSRYIKHEYLERTHAFYERHGGKTVVISRFLPIIRTYAPFVAGVGTMSNRKFSFYNLIGAVAWVCTFVYGGYIFGNVPAIKQNLTYLVIGIVLVSVLPALIGFVRARRA